MHKLDGEPTSATTPTSSTQLPQTDALDVGYNMFTIDADRGALFTAVLEIEGVQLEMDVDTGVALSLISAATYMQLWLSVKVHQLRKPSIHFCTHTREEPQLVGEAVVRMQYQNQQEDLNLVIVKGNGPSLLGRDCLQKIRLNWAEVHSQNAVSSQLEQVLTKHSSLFRDELGSIKGATVKLHIDPYAKPYIFRSCPVPILSDEG